MINLLTINELFEYIDKTLDIKHIKSELKIIDNNLFEARHKLVIKNINYVFYTMLRKFGDYYFIYFSYHIDGIVNYEVIVNNNMTIQVLNALPIVIEEYKKILIENDKQHKEIYGFYYDADEPKRRKIYDYFFRKRLGDRLYDINYGNYIIVKLKEPVLLENLTL